MSNRPTDALCSALRAIRFVFDNGPSRCAHSAPEGPVRLWRRARQRSGYILNKATTGSNATRGTQHAHLSSWVDPQPVHHTKTNRRIWISCWFVRIAVSRERLIFALNMRLIRRVKNNICIIAAQREKECLLVRNWQWETIMQFYMALLALLEVGSLEKVDLYDICLGGLFANWYAQISIIYQY